MIANREVQETLSCMAFSSTSLSKRIRQQCRVAILPLSVVRGDSTRYLVLSYIVPKIRAFYKPMCILSCCNSSLTACKQPVSSGGVANYTRERRVGQPRQLDSRYPSPYFTGCTGISQNYRNKVANIHLNCVKSWKKLKQSDHQH